MVNPQILAQYKAFLNCPNLWLNSPILNINLFNTAFKSTQNTKLIPIKGHPIFGKRAEMFLSYYLKNSGRYRVLAEQVQVHENKITKGELDFIIQDLETLKISHIELACKFYLFKPVSKNNPFKNWIGPNFKDNLDRKLEHLKNHQFPFLSNQLTQVALQKIGIDSTHVNQQLCFKSQLFVPYNFPKLALSGINPACIAGLYLSLEQLLKIYDKSTSVYIPPKNNWLLNPPLNIPSISMEQFSKIAPHQFALKGNFLIWIQNNLGAYQKVMMIQ